MPVRTAVLGFPRIGPQRELKDALESLWAGRIGEQELLDRAGRIRASSWARMAGLGIDHIPSNDFSLYDHVLDTAVLVGAIPERFRPDGGPVDLATYFALARGDDRRKPLELTKWFDTNYHYLVPELAPGQSFALSSTKPVDELMEAKALGYHTRPVLLGPVTFLMLSKTDGRRDALDLLPRLLPVYEQVLGELEAAGADWVQMDEPVLVLDLDQGARAALAQAYARLARAVGLNLLVATYFGALGDNLDTALGLPVAGLHVDLVRAPDQLADVVAGAPSHLTLSLGVVDGRNVWATDLTAVLDRIEPVVEALGQERVMLAPSCSLLHVPMDVSVEQGLDEELKSWLAFAVQKLDELVCLARALNEGRSAVADALARSDAIVAARRSSARTRSAVVADRLREISPQELRRASPYPVRRRAQADLGLPLLPTTTIGSLPQTAEVRKARADRAHGVLSEEEYDRFIEGEIQRAIRWQEEIGLDVLVHGEFERNDMVQYFAEHLDGFAVTALGWVQSYGSRCVRPPIVYGDVSRPQPITVRWITYAQSLTSRPVKGMLTGPVTMLQWSFVRDDVPRQVVCRQIALAIRDEVRDLEAAGIRVIQIDEPALREGLPLRASDRPAYLQWAVEAFRLASSGVADATQIHTHMCYSEFHDIVDSIVALDADVLSIESARSNMDLLDVFEGVRYPREIGPGVYDIHSPRVPAVDEMERLLEEAERRIEPHRLWVNPDCGLKTRSWAEVGPALANLVAAARNRRQRLAA